MARNIEIKARVSDLAAFRAKAASLARSFPDWKNPGSLGSSCFVELEVVLAPGEPAEQGYREADDLLRSLQIPEWALVAQAYIDLLENAAV